MLPSRDARFSGATFSRDAWFDRATFTRDVGFDQATFSRDARFSGATFSRDARFDTVSLSGRLSFLRVRTAKRLQLALREGSIGEVDLTEASFAGPAALTANLRGSSIRRPRLVLLVQADTTNLTVAGLDLSNCRFLGAINLERLRIDGPLLLGEAPGWWRARRRMLWEEGELRSWPGWATPDRHDGPEVTPHRGERASRLQAVYRELRKGREDAKDEPGAADFYYGEMEMRRQAARGVERWLLTGYWAASGYGLRASRAVTAFLIVVAVFAGLLYGWGFQPPSPSRITGVNMNSGAVTYAAAPPRPDLAAAFAYSAESATVFFRGSSPEQLTEWGRAFQVCLRLLGPTLLGLAVLAVRGRVKR